jgi:predicted ATPase/class 3 adenylate cyclase
VDVGAWLRGLGLDRYEQAFRDNDIDADLLPTLTADDLRELGVASLGHRKRLLAAITALAGPADPRPSPAPPLAPTPPPASTVPQAERRQLTVVFVDMVGSTALSSRLDPEDMREVLRAYQDCCAGEITRFAGHVAKYMGDGVLAYFGWPRAHEDEAERAVLRAGLAVVGAVGRLATPAGEPLAARVGIATGLVVVGDLVGEGAAREETVVGETPNLAARLQGVASQGTVVVGELTWRLLSGLFELEDLGTQALKGFAEPVRSFRVVGENSLVEGRFEARQTGAALPLVGRQHELALLMERWRLAKAGAGQVVLLTGEPGIGKSRLVLALRERLRSERRTRVRYQCSPHRTDSPLWPVVEQLERAAGFARGDLPEIRVGKLEALLGHALSDPAAAMPELAELLSLPTSGRYPDPPSTPEQRKARIFQALVSQLEGLATQGPMLMVLEDAHWLDPTTLEQFDLMIGHIEHLDVLLEVTCRPGFEPPWIGRAHTTSLSLARLGRHQAAEMVEWVTGGRTLPSEVLCRILEKTDGIPLFVEELTKAVLESGLLYAVGDRFELAGPLPPLAIPSTLQDSLMARLDRLSPAKEVAQLGAMIGREFSHELLAAAAGLPAERLEEALERLIAAELIIRRGAGPEVAYAFKHALVQDAAYASLLRSRRQEFHARLARSLEARFRELVEAQPELVARHCTEAGLAGEAIEYWWRAGRLASGRSALAEAVGHFGKALELLATLPDTPARAAQELDLLTAQGGALISAKGHSASETGRVYARARELCRYLGDTTRLHPLLFGEWGFRMVRADHAVARGIGEELLRSGEERADGMARLVGHRAVGISLLWQGHPRAAREHLERMLTLYDPERHRSLASLYAYDPRLAGQAGVCLALFQLGYPEQAVTRCDEAIREAEQLAHPAGLAYALHHACMFEHARRNPAGVRQRAAALVALCAEQSFPLWGAAGEIFQDWAAAEPGRPAEGGARIEEGIAAYRATGAALFLPYWLALLADARGASGRATEGVALLGEALDRSEATDERWFEAELHRLRGELLLALVEPDRPEAEICFGRALALAREQDAKMWELRAATSLARLWRDQGRRAEAHDLLVPVYGWFTEGFDTPDLQEAKALLEELASKPLGPRTRPRRRLAAPVNNPGFCNGPLGVKSPE